MDGLESKTRKKFDEIAGRFEYHRQATLMRAKKIKKYLTKKMVVLDVGIGNGDLVSIYSSGQKIIGVDFSKKMLKIAKKKLHNCRLVVADGRSIPLKENKFDLVISSETIYYVSSPIIFLREIYRVLGHNGRVILICRNQLWRGLDKIRKIFNLGLVDDLNYIAYFKNEIEELLSTAKFKNINSECFGVLPIRKFEFLDNTPLKNIGHMIFSTAKKTKEN
jgi:ubiquinone/menaquinone biosynthesis C-methylase UbiE